MLDIIVGIVVTALCTFVIVLLTFFVGGLRDEIRDLKKQVDDISEKLKKNRLLPYRSFYDGRYFSSYITKEPISISDIEDRISRLVDHLGLEEKEVSEKPATIKLVKRKEKK